MPTYFVASEGFRLCLLVCLRREEEMVRPPGRCFSTFMIAVQKFHAGSAAVTRSTSVSASEGQEPIAPFLKHRFIGVTSIFIRMSTFRLFLCQGLTALSSV